MRGKPYKLTLNSSLARITPADAGKTLEECICYDDVEDHPRGCGENLLNALPKHVKIGSPPRMRGKLFISFLK